MVEEGYFTDSEPLLVSLLNPSRTYFSDAFSITDSMDVSGSINVNVLLAAVSSGSISLQQETSPDNWTTIASDTFNILVGGLGNVASIDLSTLPLAEGNYRVSATLSGALDVSIRVDTNVDVTYTDQFLVDTVTPDAGNILDNDDIGSAFTTLRVFDGTEFVTVSGTAQFQGTWGQLTIDAEGNYTYTPVDPQPFFDTPQTDSFTYQLVNPAGATSTGTLDITVQPSGAGVPDPVGLFAQDESGGDGLLGEDAELVSYAFLEEGVVSPTGDDTFASQDSTSSDADSLILSEIFSEADTDVLNGTTLAPDDGQVPPTSGEDSSETHAGSTELLFALPSTSDELEEGLSSTPVV